MPYATNIDVVPILAATLHLLENGQSPEKDSPSIQRVTNGRWTARRRLTIKTLVPISRQRIQSIGHVLMTQFAINSATGKISPVPKSMTTVA
jgi:hypothetical protein